MEKMLFVLLVLILAQVATVAFGAQSRSGVVIINAYLSSQASAQDAKLWIP